MIINTEYGAITINADKTLLLWLDRELGALHSLVNVDGEQLLHALPILCNIWYKLPTYSGTDYNDYWDTKVTGYTAI